MSENEISRRSYGAARRVQMTYVEDQNKAIAIEALRKEAEQIQGAPVSQARVMRWLTTVALNESIMLTVRAGLAKI